MESEILPFVKCNENRLSDCESSYDQKKFISLLSSLVNTFQPNYRKKISGKHFTEELGSFLNEASHNCLIHSELFRKNDLQAKNT